jgi:hypothetical protein
MPKQALKKQNAATSTSSRGQGSTRRGCLDLLLLLLPSLVLLRLFRTGGTINGYLQGTKSLQESTICYISGCSKSNTAAETILHGPSQSLVQAALEFVKQREEAYRDQQVHPHWKMRGHGHLYTYKKIVLAGHARVLSAKKGGAVQIFNVHPETNSTFQDCHLLTLWVRVDGPEIMAGKAKAITINSTISTAEFKCYWTYDFDILVPGNYTVDAKILQWNGNAPVKNYHSDNVTVDQGNSQCSQVHPGNFISQEAFNEAPQNTSFLMFKPYSPLQGCCEICRRTPHCKYFATPPRILPMPSFWNNGCELFFGPDVDPVEDVPKGAPQVMQNVIDWMYRTIANEQRVAAEKAANPTVRHDRHRRLAIDGAWGSPQSDNGQVQHFLGCGWSFFHALEFPCISGDLDDQILMEQDNFEVPTEAEWIPKPHQQPALPWCEIQDEYVLSNTNAFSQANQRHRNGTVQWANIGRWVREPYPNSEQCPLPFEFFPATSYSNMNAISRSDPDRPHCWFRDDLTSLNKGCKEMNCGSIQPSHKWNATKLQHERDWMAMWRNYHCDYQEFTDDQLSQCFQTQKIKGLEKAGASISNMLQRYFQSRLENVTFYDANATDAQRVVFHTLQWPHFLWHDASDAFASHLDKEIPNVLNTATIAFWVSPFFVSSEREPHVTLERAIAFMDVAERVLAPKGYQMLNAFDLSAAVTVSFVLKQFWISYSISLVDVY